MARIYKLTDKIKYQIGELSVSISPLSVNDKNILIDYQVKGTAKRDVNALLEGAIYTIQCAVKAVSGLEDSEGNPYQLQFDESGKLTRECAEELLNIEQSNQLISLCASFANGVPSKLPEGVSVAESPNKKAQD